MAQVTKCDRCKATTPFSIGDAGGAELDAPMKVKIPSGKTGLRLSRGDGGKDEYTSIRLVETVELCAMCLKDLEKWYQRAVKE